MNIELLNERVNEVKTEMNQNRLLADQHKQAIMQLNADYNALEGAKNEVDKWIKKLSNKDVVE